MKIALVYDRGSRVGVGERCRRVLEHQPGLEVSQFDLKEIRQVTEGFDLYLRLDDGDYAAPFPAGLHPYAWWVADTHLEHPLGCIIRNSPDCDALFCFQKEGAWKVGQTTGRLVRWLPPACDEAGPAPVFVPHRERRWDIAFVGTTGKYTLRKVVLELVKSSYPNAFVGTAHHSELFSIYSQARIVVNYAINNDINMRIFEAMAAGALVLNNRILDNGFEDIFAAGRDCVVFDDPTTGGLKRSIDHYLAHRDEGERIARAGFALAGRNTYRQRLAEILRVMGWGGLL